MEMNYIEEVHLFESLVFDDLEQLGIFYDTSLVWKEFLSSGKILEFLTYRFGLKQVPSDFASLREMNPEEVTTVPDEDYFYENDCSVDPWSAVLLLRGNTEESLGFLLDVMEILFVDDFYLSLWSYVVGSIGSIPLFDFFQHVFSEEIWGPSVVGAACSGNVALLSYIYEEILSEEYFDTSDYYSDWTRMALKLSITTNQKESVEYLESL
jgi:hypothetical protein